MSHPVGDFVVYPCEACGERIFTERVHLGGTGVCPLCGAEHTVGGTPTVSAEEGTERRASARVPVQEGKVALAHGQPGGAPVASDQLHPVRDLSETGLAFRLQGERDPRHLSGVRPPALRVGQVVQIGLRAKELFRPRSYRAEVRRVEKAGREDYTIGVRFTDLSPEQRSELSALVRRLGSS